MPLIAAPGRSARLRFRPRTRTFYAVLILMAIAALCALFVPTLRASYYHYFYPDRDKSSPDDTASGDAFLNLVIARTAIDSTECVWVHKAEDQCSFVMEHCVDNQPSLLPYLRFYYCAPTNARPLVFALMVVWLGLLFTTIGIAASDFFSVNLGAIAAILHLPESLVGVTFLAFGNGSPDLFSTFAAMGSNSASMAVGELIGAAGFISAVVAGSMALVREFKVDRKTYVRDVSFLMAAVALTCGFLIDGELHLWECVVMIMYYCLYVVTVVGGHWLLSRRAARVAVKTGSQPTTGSPVLGSGHLVPEPFRDSPRGETTSPIQIGQVGRSDTDASFLELGPRIEISNHADDDDELNDEDSRLLAAEVASQMRVLHPRGRRRTSIVPIRPSLVGALEFRSALAQAARGHSSQRTNSFPILTPRPAPPRIYTDDPAPGEQEQALGGLAAAPSREDARTIDIAGEHLWDTYTWPDQPAAPGPAVVVVSSAESPLSSPPRRPPLRPVLSSSTIDGKNLALPLMNMLGRPPDASQNVSLADRNKLNIELPDHRRVDSNGDKSGASDALSPFPQYLESPLVMSPLAEPAHVTPDSISPLISPPSPSPFETNNLRSSNFFSNFAGDNGNASMVTNISPRCRFWPYRFLPPPDIVLRTLFPTVQDWREKSIWDKFVSAMSIPSVFLLVITLPVVEMEKDLGNGEDDNDGEAVVDPPGLGIGRGLAEEAVVARDSNGPEPDGDRYPFRIRTRTQTGSSTIHSTAPMSLRSPSLSRTPSITRSFIFPDGPDRQKAAKSANPDEDEEGDINKWNRWLVILQTLTGPQFAVSILWANIAEDISDARQAYTWMALSALAVSVVLCGLILTTTTGSHRPKYHSLLCFLGFLISIAWISTIAGEVVGVLKAAGIVLNISEAILGLTVFAAGNSVGDLVADITVARLGYPVMAL